MSDVILPRVKAAMVDYVGVGLAGSRAPEVAALTRYVHSQYRDGDATVFGHEQRLAPDGAALLNGTMAHWHEFDDANWSMSGHPTVTIMPALLAAAEGRRVSGRALIAAYLVGFEIAAKVGLLVNPHQIRVGWHPTATLGSLGAALAVAKVLGQTPDQMEMALAIVGSNSSGLRTNFGTMTKPLHAGAAARSGVLAAFLAQDGFTGAPGILEHAHGYVHAFSGGRASYDEAEVIASIGNPLDIEHPGVGFKHFPSSFQTHAGITAMVQLVREEGLRAEDVESIACRGNHLLQLSLMHHRPTRGLQGKLSLEFCLAATLLNGWPAPEHYTDEYVNRPEVLALIEKITVGSHPDMEGLDMTKGEDFLAMEVVVTRKDGSTVTRRVASEAEFSLPGVEDGAVAKPLLEKFQRNAAPSLRHDAIDRFLESVDAIATLDDVDALTRPLREPSDHGRA